MIRCFIATELKISPKIVEFINDIKKTGANIKLVEPENMHLTLKFLGDTNEELIDKIEQIIEESVKEIKPFNIELMGAGVFPNKNYIKVIWIGIEKGEHLKTIAKKIDENISKLGFQEEKRDFSPHLTIGRVRTAKNKEKILQIIEKYEHILFTKNKIDSIKLIKSELTQKGPIYTTIKEIKLNL